MNAIISRIVYEYHFRVLKVKLIFLISVMLFYDLQISKYPRANKSLTNMMNLTQNGTAGYLNTIRG